MAPRVYFREYGSGPAWPVSKSRESAACVPGTTVEAVPGAGHALTHEDPAATAASVRRALGG